MTRREWAVVLALGALVACKASSAAVQRAAAPHLEAVGAFESEVAAHKKTYQVLAERLDVVEGKSGALPTLQQGDVQKARDALEAASGAIGRVGGAVAAYKSAAEALRSARLSKDDLEEREAALQQQQEGVQKALESVPPELEKADGLVASLERALVKAEEPEPEVIRKHPQEDAE